MRAPGTELSFRRWLTQSLLGRILILGSIVIALLLGSSAVDYYVVGQWENYGQAVWSGLLHFIAPGTLVRDRTVPERVVGVFQVLTGLVFYVGLLIAVITAGVSRSMKRFRSYEAPLHVRGHLLFIGEQDDLSFVLRALQADLFGQQDAVGSAPRSIVAMIPESMRESRMAIAEQWQEDIPGVLLRVVVADPQSTRAYQLVSAEHASQIVIGSADSLNNDAVLADFRTSKTLLSVSQYLDQRCQGVRPRVLVDIRRGRHADAFARTRWGQRTKPLVRDRGLGARLRFGVMHPEYSPFLGSGGQGAWRQTDVIKPTGFVGSRFEDLAGLIPHALPIGIVADDGSHVRVTLPPASGYAIRSTDQLVLLRSHIAVTAGPPRRRARSAGVRLLIVGWAAPTRELLRALAARRDPIEQITIVSRTDWRSEIGSDTLPPNMTTITGDFALPAILDRAVAEADPDTIIVTSKFDSNAEADDARTAFAVMRLRQLTARSGVPIFALFARPVSPAMFDDEPRIVVSSAVQIESASIALAVSRYEVNAVMRDLLGGRDVESVRVAPVGSIVSTPTKFSEIYSLLLSIGEIPLSAHTKSGQLLYPPHPEQILGEGDSLMIARVDDQSASTNTLVLGLHTGL